MSTSTSTTQSEAGGLRSAPGLDPREVPGSLAHAEAHPEQAIVWARAHRERWSKRYDDNSNREAGWSLREAQECDRELAFANAVELRAVYALLGGVNPAAVQDLVAACRAAQSVAAHMGWNLGPAGASIHDALVKAAIVEPKPELAMGPKARQVVQTLVSVVGDLSNCLRDPDKFGGGMTEDALTDAEDAVWEAGELLDGGAA